MLVNDEEAATAGEVTLAFERGGRVLASRQAPFSLAPLGQQTLLLGLRAPDAPGPAVLTATARRTSGEATTSRRKVEITRQ
jgi:hypothetical protein